MQEKSFDYSEQSLNKLCKGLFKLKIRISEYFLFFLHDLTIICCICGAQAIAAHINVIMNKHLDGHGLCENIRDTDGFNFNDHSQNFAIDIFMSHFEEEKI